MKVISGRSSLIKEKKRPAYKNPDSTVMNDKNVILT